MVTLIPTPAVTGISLLILTIGYASTRSPPVLYQPPELLPTHVPAGEIRPAEPGRAEMVKSIGDMVAEASHE